MQGQKYYFQNQSISDHFDKRAQVIILPFGKQVEQNFLINEFLYADRLKHKIHMFPDDPSIQFENISNVSLGSKHNSIPSFVNTFEKNKYIQIQIFMKQKKNLLKFYFFKKKKKQKITKEL